MYGNQNLRRRNIVIAGPQGSGKTPLAEMLAGATGQPWADTSDAVIHSLARVLSAEDVRDVMPDPARCVAERVERMKNHKKFWRSLLVAHGHELTRRAPSCLLIEASMNGATILAGPRRKIEVEAWFSSHPADIFVEIAGDTNTRDDVYELSGWHQHRPHYSLLVDGQQSFAQAVKILSSEPYKPFNLDKPAVIPPG